MTIENPASKTTINRVNALSRRIFRLNSKRAALKSKHQAAQERLKSKFSAEDAKLKAQFDSDTAALASLVRNNKARLVEPGKQSFVTMFAKFGFRSSKTAKVVNKDGIDKKIRELGITKLVAKRRVVVVYDFQMDLLEELLEKRPELKSEFDGLIEWPGDKESLNVKPNEAYFTQHDSSRLSDKAIPLPDAN